MTVSLQDRLSLDDRYRPLPLVDRAWLTRLKTATDINAPIADRFKTTP